MAGKKMQGRQKCDKTGKEEVIGSYDNGFLMMIFLINTCSNGDFDCRNLL